jgi:hypothetical protein
MSSKGKSRAKILPPPIPPQSPIPAGEHPPAQTKEEREAWSKYWTDNEKYMASLFDLDCLQEIVAASGAPALPNTFNAQAVVHSVACGIANRYVPPNPVIKDTQEQIRRRKKEWAAIRKYVAKLADSQHSQKQWFTERPWYGSDAVKFRDDYAGRLDAFLAAMDEVEPWLFLSSRKKRGQHGGAAISNPVTAIDLYTRLSWAWEDAGLLGDVTKEARYQIVLACLELMGECASIDAIRKIITKALKTDPWRTDRAAYEAKLISMHEELNAREKADGKGD